MGVMMDTDAAKMSRKKNKKMFSECDDF